MSLNGDVIGHISELFNGLRCAHGVFFPERFEGKKQIGKATTERQPITDALWNAHLKGEVGLGVIPINEESRCKWAVIDVDKYDLDFFELLTSIRNTPLVCCRSKSGGAHLFLFVRDFVSVHIVRNYMRNMVANLGLGNSEIFPKQDRIQADRGDVGNWLNMPYFGNDRRALALADASIRELTLEEFIEYAEEKAVITSFFEDAPEINYDDSPLEGGPPCLQVMTLKGFPPHTRNIALFNIGVYAKKAMPAEWKIILRKFNLEFFKGDVLRDREVEEIIKSLDKKEYSYQCYEEPLCSFCNAKLCRTRKFGISNVVGLPIINSVTKVTGDISVWFIDVEGGRLELTTEEVYSNRKFNLRCLNDLNILPSPMRPEKWIAFIQTMVDQAIEIRDEQLFERSLLPEHFKSFIVTRLSKNPGDVEINRTWYDKDNYEVRFKFDAFLNYLKFRKANIQKAAIVMYFKSRVARYSVAKDKFRRSFKYMAIRLSDEEEIMIQEKQKGDTVL
jgi:hypothetical protein